jgi:hypothetical protein
MGAKTKTDRHRDSLGSPCPSVWLTRRTIPEESRPKQDIEIIVIFLFFLPPRRILRRRPHSQRVKRVRAKRPEAKTSNNHSSLSKGVGNASTCPENFKKNSLLKSKEERNRQSSIVRTATSSGPVARQSKILRPDAPSNRVVEGVDLFHLYNILLASKRVRPAIRRSQLHTTKPTPPIDQAPILTTQEAARIFKVTAKTFLQRYAPLLHPIPSINHSSRRRHLRWSRSEIERLARGYVASAFESGVHNDDLTFVSRALEKRLE